MKNELPVVTTQRQLNEQNWSRPPLDAHPRVPQSGTTRLLFAGDLSNETDDEAAQRKHERQRETLKITMW